MTKNQTAIRDMFKVTTDSTGNLPPLPAVFPDNPAPVIRNFEAERKLTMMRWGMLSSPAFEARPLFGFAGIRTDITAPRRAAKILYAISLIDGFRNTLNNLALLTIEFRDGMEYSYMQHLSLRQPFFLKYAALSKLVFGAIVAAVATAALLATPDIADAQTFTKTFSFPVGTSSLTVGVDGNFYGLTNTDSGGTNSAISTFTPSGQQATYSFATNPTRQGFALTAGPDGNIWFIVTSPNGTATTTVARMTPQGSFTFFQIDPGYSQGLQSYNLIDLAPSRDNGIYSIYKQTDNTSGTPFGRYEVGLIYPDGTVDPHRAVLAYGGTNSVVGNGALGSKFIVSDDKGTAYFPESFFSPRVDQIDRQDAAGNPLAPLTLPTSSTFGQIPPLTYGPDGAIWFLAIETASPNTRYIGRFTTDGAFSRYELPSGVTIGSKFVVGLDGALWTTGMVNGVSSLVRVATTGAISGVPIPSAIGSPSNGLVRSVDGVLYYVAQTTSGLYDLVRFDPAAPTNYLVSAVLPSSRSVQSHNSAAAFATIVNASNTAGTNCGLASISDPSATFQFATTDSATNMITGAPRQRVNIPSGRAQSFVFQYDTTGAYRPTADVQIGFSCDNLPAAATIIGVNSFHLTSDDNPVPDVIAVGLTPSNDGVAHTGGVGGTGIFAVATDNIGFGGTVTARARPLNSDTAVLLTVCETDATTGACKSAPSSNVRRTIASGETPTWGVFAQASADIPLDPAHNRIVFEFVDDAGIVRGSTGTAVSSH